MLGPVFNSIHQPRIINPSSTKTRLGSSGSPTPRRPERSLHHGCPALNGSRHLAQNSRAAPKQRYSKPVQELLKIYGSFEEILEVSYEASRELEIMLAHINEIENEQPLLALRFRAKQFPDAVSIWLDGLATGESEIESYPHIAFYGVEDTAFVPPFDTGNGDYSGSMEDGELGGITSHEGYIYHDAGHEPDAPSMLALEYETFLSSCNGYATELPLIKAEENEILEKIESTELPDPVKSALKQMVTNSEFCNGMLHHLNDTFGASLDSLSSSGDISKNARQHDEAYAKVARQLFPPEFIDEAPELAIEIVAFLYLKQSS